MDKKEVSKRQRSENWNEDDKMLLKELIRKRVKQIEDKSTDNNTNQKKKKAWLEVEGSFNELCTGGHRSMTQLKTQWAATKISARKEVAEHRKAVSKTGGGSQPIGIPIDSNDISVWLPNEFVIDSNEFDSDFVSDSLIVEVEDETKTMPIEKIDDIIEIDGAEIFDETELPKVTPKSTPISKKKIPAENVTHDSIKKLTTFDIECRKELHELQTEVEQKKLRNLDKKYDVLIAQEEKEKAKIRNLGIKYLQKKIIWYVWLRLQKNCFLSNCNGN